MSWIRLTGERSSLMVKMHMKRWYQSLAEGTAQHRDWTFMNYGYVPLEPGDTPLAALRPEDHRNRYPIQLYHHLLSKVPIEGRDVLDTGCGRGGGASYLARYLSPASVTGVDFSDKVIELCRAAHAGLPIRFQQGDAEMLPFDDGSFDVVISVEASHCFGSMPRFLAGARRVLREGGHLLFADFRDEEELRELSSQLAESGFELVEEQDITANVLAALDLEAEIARRRAVAVEVVPDHLREAFATFAADRGTALYESLARGGTRYLSWHISR